MNKNRKKKLDVLMKELGEIRDKIYVLLEEEQEYYDNIPDNLLGSERAEISEESIELLESAIESLEEVIYL